MAALLEVRRRVPAGRRVAAADVPAGEADPEVQPLSADLQAVFTTRRRSPDRTRHFRRDVIARKGEIDVVQVRHVLAAWRS